MKRLRSRGVRPLYFGGKLIVPNVGMPVARSQVTTPFFVSILPGEGAAPKARLELLQRGQVLGRVALELADADVSGRIQQAGQLSTGTLAPGSYVARVTVQQGSALEVREATFTIVE